jgi:hypothetical protein
VGADGISHDFTRNAFTSVPNYNAALARAIAVVPATPGAQAAGASQNSAPASPADAAQAIAATASPGPVAANANVPAPGGPRTSLRSAITLRVR